MNGKQLIALGLLVSGGYIYFSFKNISKELSKENNQTTPIQILHIEKEEKNNTKIIQKVIESSYTIIKTPIKHKAIEEIENKSLESEIEAALKEISTVQSINN